MDGLQGLLDDLGIKPRDIEIYRRALRHISVPQDHSDSYETLEFLGDSIIGMVIADYLVRRYPEERVGQLTRLRALAVNQDSLSHLAKKIGLEKFIEIEHSKMRDKSGVEESVMADCFESLVGAIMLDRGVRAARAFALRYLRPVIDEAVHSGDLIDHKSSLQEYLQQKYRQIPRYHRLSAAGPDHAKIFTVECTFRGSTLSKGTGTSLKRAEQDAARKAMKKLKKKTKPR